MPTSHSRKPSMATAAALLIAALAGACGGNGDDQNVGKGQDSLEVYAELTQSGIAASRRCRMAS